MSAPCHARICTLLGSILKVIAAATSKVKKVDKILAISSGVD